MKTAERTGERWVVEVVDQRNVEQNMPGYSKRFTFEGDDAAPRAWTCWASAERHGFKATVERVKRA